MFPYILHAVGTQNYQNYLILFIDVKNNKSEAVIELVKVALFS